MNSGDVVVIRQCLSCLQLQRGGEGFVGCCRVAVEVYSKKEFTFARQVFRGEDRVLWYLAFFCSRPSGYLAKGEKENDDGDDEETMTMTIVARSTSTTVLIWTWRGLSELI